MTWVAKNVNKMVILLTFMESVFPVERTVKKKMSEAANEIKELSRLRLPAICDGLVRNYWRGEHVSIA